jgi:hypothetical protein
MEEPGDYCFDYERNEVLGILGVIKNHLLRLQSLDEQGLGMEFHEFRFFHSAVRGRVLEVQNGLDLPKNFPTQKELTGWLMRLFSREKSRLSHKFKVRVWIHPPSG